MLSHSSILNRSNTNTEAEDMNSNDNMQNGMINENFTSFDGNKTNTNKKKWSPDEDELLMRAVSIYGKKSWSAVSTLVPGRNPKQCRERWTAQINPQLTKQNWTMQEDQKLIQLQLIHGNVWAHIALFLPGRSGNSVKNRFNWLERRNLTKLPIMPHAKFPQSMPSKRPLPVPIISQNHHFEQQSDDFIESSDFEPSSPENQNEMKPDLNSNELYRFDTFPVDEYEGVWIDSSPVDEFSYFNVEY